MSQVDPKIIALVVQKMHEMYVILLNPYHIVPDAFPQSAGYLLTPVVLQQRVSPTVAIYYR